MTRLPVIVGFGGINAAGRSSNHHGYRRMVIEALPKAIADETLLSLARLMNLDVEAGLTESTRQHILSNTLIRRIGAEHFDVDNVPWNKRMQMLGTGDARGVSFRLSNKHLPEQIPANWVVTPVDDKLSQVEVFGELDCLLPTPRSFNVRAAGQLPTGFDPQKLYQSRSHPRGLQMTVYGASDALGSVGIDWSLIQKKVSPDQISVYAGSGMSQLDGDGNGGMMMSRLTGKKVTSKHCPFGFAEMPADFINAYVLGSLGTTGTSMGACASFLYNLRMGLMDIQSGKSRVVIVGNSEAPITPEIMEGYAAMGALATDDELLELDKEKELKTPDYRRAARPFSTNCGFTIAESAQFVVLFDDELAMELGATVYGAVTDVFVNADGHKKSISSPGVGNYITMAKATAAARALVGDEGLRQRSFVQAHGTSTPQNRVTESHILNETAKAFGIESWPVAAMKSYLGHTIGVAAGDQVVASLGVWKHGVIPGITTIDHIAPDVHASHLAIRSKHLEVGPQGTDVAVINAKGFGGNNASATLLAPHVVMRMLEKRYGRGAMVTYKARNEVVQAQAQRYESDAMAGTALPVYKFDHQVVSGEQIEFDDRGLKVPGYDHIIQLPTESVYQDLVVGQDVNAESVPDFATL